MGFATLSPSYKGPVLFRGGGLRLRPGVGERLHRVLVPGAGEAAAAYLVAREDVVIDRPFGARHFVEYLDAIAVGVAQINAERDAVISDVVDLDPLRLDAAIKIFQIVEALEAPGHVVEAHLKQILGHVTATAGSQVTVCLERWIRPDRKHGQG